VQRTIGVKARSAADLFACRYAVTTFSSHDDFHAVSCSANYYHHHHHHRRSYIYIYMYTDTYRIIVIVLFTRTRRPRRSNRDFITCIPAFIARARRRRGDNRGAEEETSCCREAAEFTFCARWQSGDTRKKTSSHCDIRSYLRRAQISSEKHKYILNVSRVVLESRLRYYENSTVKHPKRFLA